MKNFRESRSKLFKSSRIIIAVLVTVSFLLTTSTFSYWAVSVQGDSDQNTVAFTIGEYVREITEYIFEDGLSNVVEIITSNSDDIVEINGRVEDDAILNTSSGNDIITVENHVKDQAVILTGTGNDTVTLDRSILNNAVLNTGDGNDSIFIYKIGNKYKGTIDAGSGDDIVTIVTVRTNSATIDGGSGEDILYLENYTVSQWNSGISDSFTGFEKVVLKDGVVTY